MIEWMIRLLNMSFTAGCTVLFVLVCRLLFKKLPKGYSYVLWFIVLFRFLCPVTVPSPFCLLPVHPEPVPQEIVYEQHPEIQSGVIWVDRAVNQMLDENLSAEEWEVRSINPIQIALFVLGVIWQAGVLVLFLYYMTGYLRLRRRLAAAVQVEKGIYESSQIDGAFVTGLFRPSVYLPAGLDEENRRYILKHEMVHIRRKDYLVKLLGLLMVLIHWFNPLAWISFRLLSRDMEMSCDERVLKELGPGEKKPYSLALLHAAEQQGGLLIPLAFGESHTRSRIKNILNYRKPAFWITVLAAAAIGMAGVGLMTDPVVQKTVEETGDRVATIIGGADGPTSIFIAGKAGEGESAELDRIPDIAWLAETTIPEALLEEGQDGMPVLDYADKDMVIFHGSFGLFAFQREGDRWSPAAYLDQEYFSDDDQALEALAGIGSRRKQGEIHMEDKLVTSASIFGNDIREAAVQKLEDGNIAVLGGYMSGDRLRLIDLFYGYYHPDEQVFHQVYLFGGNGEMTVNPRGDVHERRYLFSRDGADYYVRTPKSLMDFEKKAGMESHTYHLPYGRMELVRRRGDEETVLDEMMCMQSGLEQQKVIVAQDRIVYTGAAFEDMVSVKSPGLISIAMDGSDRRAADIPYNVYDGLSYEGGYLYYQGWTNDRKLPVPLYRMDAKFEHQEFLAEVDGSLMTVKEGGVVYIYNWAKQQVEVCGTEIQGKRWRFDRPGEDARHHLVETERIGNVMTITLKPVDPSEEPETYRVYVPKGM